MNIIHLLAWIALVVVSLGFISSVLFIVMTWRERIVVEEITVHMPEEEEEEIDLSLAAKPVIVLEDDYMMTIHLGDPRNTDISLHGSLSNP